MRDVPTVRMAAVGVLCDDWRRSPNVGASQARGSGAKQLPYPPPLRFAGGNQERRNPIPSKHCGAPGKLERDNDGNTYYCALGWSPVENEYACTCRRTQPSGEFARHSHSRIQASRADLQSCDSCSTTRYSSAIDNFDARIFSFGDTRKIHRFVTCPTTTQTMLLPGACVTLWLMQFASTKRIRHPIKEGSFAYEHSQRKNAFA
jgi:hypothetical protein